MGTPRVMPLVAVLGAASLLAACEARGGTEASAAVQVVAHVQPRLAVTSQAPTVDVGLVQKGDFSATIGFRVEAGVDRIQLSVSATDLYKGGVPSEATVAPIPLATSRGVLIAPSDATALGGGSGVAKFIASGSIGEFSAQTTECIAFGSKHQGRFGQDVRVIVTWSQDDDAKPQGEYCGRIRLTATILP
jgi:hypothetical protein